MIRMNLLEATNKQFVKVINHKFSESINPELLKTILVTKIAMGENENSNGSNNKVLILFL